MNWNGFKIAMKRVCLVLACAVVMFLIASCTWVVSREIKEEQRIEDQWPASKMSYVEFDGHEYVLLDKFGARSGGITHSPKCECLRKEKHNDTER